jgi:hypothetical protein
MAPRGYRGARVACLLVFLAAATVPAPLLPGLDLSVNTGMLFIGSVPPSGTVGRSLDITYLVGLSIPLRLGNVFFFEPMIEGFSMYYEWVDSAAVAIPSDQESELGFFTLGSLISLHAGVEFPVSAAISLGGSLGVDFLLRLPIALPSDQPASVAGRELAPGFFYGMGRFFYPETRFILRWKLSDMLTATAGLRAFYPLFHLWDGAGASFFDQLMFAGGLGIAIRLGGAKPSG